MSNLTYLIGGVFQWILQTTWQAAVLTGLILLAQWLLRKRLSPTWRYGLWLLLVVRLLMPVLPQSAFSVFNLAGTTPSHLVATSPPPLASAYGGNNPGKTFRSDVPTVAKRSGETVLAHSPTAVKPTWKMDWFGVALCGWLAGVCFFGARLVWTNGRFRARIGRYQPIEDANVMRLFNECRTIFKINRPVQLIESEEVESPAVYGLWRKWLLLPDGIFERFSTEQLRCIFLHELAHIKRGDLGVNWLVAWLQVLHWFNPALWLAWARMKADREMATDAFALAHVHASDHAPYGETILKVLEGLTSGRALPELVGIAESNARLKERLAAISRPGKYWKWAALAVTVLIAGIALTGAQTEKGGGSGPAGTSWPDSTGITGTPVNVDATDTPAPPVAPSQLANELIGVWTLVGTPGHASNAPAAGGRIKFFTGSHLCMTQADPKTGVVMFNHGGTYRLDGNEYYESLDYANPSTMQFIGHTGKFSIQINGDLLTDVGVDNPWREVWKRLKPDAATAASPFAKELTGTWILVKEAGKTPPAGKDLKFCVDGHWCDTYADPTNGLVVVHHGGTYTLEGNTYTETVHYANPGTLNLVGQNFKFDMKLQGDTLTLAGIGNPWNEVWKRAN